MSQTVPCYPLGLGDGIKLDGMDNYMYVHVGSEWDSVGHPR